MLRLPLLWLSHEVLWSERAGLNSNYQLCDLGQMTSFLFSIGLGFLQWWG